MLLGCMCIKFVVNKIVFWIYQLLLRNFFVLEALLLLNILQARKLAPTHIMHKTFGPFINWSSMIFSSSVEDHFDNEHFKWWYIFDFLRKNIKIISFFNQDLEVMWVFTTSKFQLVSWTCSWYPLKKACERSWFYI